MTSLRPAWLAIGGNHAGGGPRFHQVSGLLDGGRYAHLAAVGLHDVELPANAGLLQAVSQRRQIAFHQGTKKCVHHCRAGAFIFAHLGQDFVGAGDKYSRAEHPSDDCGNLLLVLRIGIGVQKADRDRLDVGCLEALSRVEYRLFVQRHAHCAVGAQPFANLKAVTPRHQRLGLHIVQIIEFRHAYTAEFQNIAEPGRSDQAGARALVFKDGIGRDGGCVHHLFNLIGLNAVVGQQFCDTLADAPAVVVRRGGDLYRKEQAALIHQHDVGEGSTDINANAIGILFHADQPPL